MFREETFLQVYPEAHDLFRSHREEVNLFDLPLDIDWRTYSSLSDAGFYKVYTYREAGELKGYCGMFLFNHSHHKTSLQAKQDVLFIKKERRGKGLSFLTYCELELKKLGVQIIHQCVPASNDWSKVLLRKGYQELETIYIKEL